LLSPLYVRLLVRPIGPRALGTEPEARSRRKGRVIER
jgi:hypothetical protein